MIVLGRKQRHRFSFMRFVIRAERHGMQCLFPSMQQDVVEKWQGVFGEKNEDDEEDGGAVLV